MIVEENEVLEQGSVAILADWRRYYPNQFPDHGLPLVNPRNPYQSRFSPKVACLARISVTRDEAHSGNEESARPCSEATQKLCNWVCAATASRAFWISGHASRSHRPASYSGAQSFTHTAWCPGIPYRFLCWTPSGFGEGTSIQYSEPKGAYPTSDQV